MRVRAVALVGAVGVGMLAWALPMTMAGAATPTVQLADPSVPGAGPFVSILLGRTMWSQSENCRASDGQPTLFDVAGALATRGMAPTGVVVPSRAAETGVTCTKGNLYPSWEELGRLRDQFGWSFVSNGQQRIDITSLPRPEQVAESCGSLDAFTAHGHTRAWGMFGPGSNRITPEIAVDVVAPCFGFIRSYSGTSRNTRAEAASPPYYVRTDDTNGGTCNRAPCTGAGAYTRPYRLPSVVLEEVAAAGPDEWIALSSYKQVSGAQLTGDRTWDCSSPDPSQHWTSELESYCLVDLLAIVDGLPPNAIATDPAAMAERWGRVPKAVALRQPLPGVAPKVAPLPNPLNAYGEFTASPVPSRVLDTRQGDGAEPAVAISAGEPRIVQVTGVAGVPAGAVQQVALNVTVTAATAAGELDVRAAGSPPPTTSNLSYGAGDTTANFALTPVSADGKIELRVSAGSAHVIVDVVGWVTTEQSTAPGSRLIVQTPERRLDTRGGDPLGAGEEIAVAVVPPDQGITGVVLNLTGTQPTAGTYLTVYPEDQPRPNTSNLNLSAGETKPNVVMMRVPPSGVLRIFNGAGSAHVLVDVLGTFRVSDTRDDLTGRLVPLTEAVRLVDTRVANQPLRGPGQTTWDLRSVATSTGVPVRGLLMNLIASAATTPTFLTVHPGGASPPNASNLNVVPGAEAANLVVADLAADASLSVTVGDGSLQLTMDLAAVILS